MLNRLNHRFGGALAERTQGNDKYDVCWHHTSASLKTEDLLLWKVRAFCLGQQFNTRQILV